MQNRAPAGFAAWHDAHTGPAKVVGVGVGAAGAWGA
jgi:hypothetical protein